MPNTPEGDDFVYGTLDSRYGDEPLDDIDFRCALFSIVAQPLSVVTGEVSVDELVLPLRILLCGFATYRALLFAPFARSAVAIMFATGVYSQPLDRFTHARHGRPRSHLVCQ